MPCHEIERRLSNVTTATRGTRTRVPVAKELAINITTDIDKTGRVEEMTCQQRNRNISESGRWHIGSMAEDRCAISGHALSNRTRHLTVNFAVQVRRYGAQPYRLRFVLPVTPQSQIVSLAVGVDDINLNSLSVNRAHHHSRTICQQSTHAVTDKAIPSAARTQTILYLGQNGRRGIGSICIRRPPSLDGVGMGKGSRAWVRCWERQHVLFILLAL
jgi:hypothetical protein